MGVDFDFDAMVYREERLGNKDSLGLAGFVKVSELETPLLLSYVSIIRPDFRTSMKLLTSKAA
jgi:hypothetical protein